MNCMHCPSLLCFTEFERGESFDCMVPLCYLSQGELRVVYIISAAGDRRYLSLTRFPSFAGPCVASLVMWLLAVYKKEEESREVLFKYFVSFQRTKPKPKPKPGRGMSHIRTSWTRKINWISELWTPKNGDRAFSNGSEIFHHRSKEWKSIKTILICLSILAIFLFLFLSKI